MKHNRTFKLADIKMTVAALDTLSRYVSPINPAVFPHLTLVLLGIGLFFTAWFFVYEVGNFISETRTISKKFSPGDLDQVHSRVDQGVGDLWGGQPLHGLWHTLPPPLGRNLCLRTSLSMATTTNVWHC